MKTRPTSSKVTGFWRARSPSGVALAERQRLAHRQPGERAVHRPGVEVAEAEPLRERGARPCSCRPRRGRRWRRSSLRRSARGARRSRGRISPRSRRPRSRRPSRDQTLQRPRASRSGGRRATRPCPPRGRVGTPVTEKPSSCPFARPPIARSASTSGLDPVGLLEAQLAGAVDPALAARAGREQPEERQLVDEQRHLVALDRRRRQLGARAPRASPDLLGADARAAARIPTRAPIRSSTSSSPVRRGLRLTSWIVIRDSGTSVAATMNGAADEKSPGHVDRAEAGCRSRRSTLTEFGRTSRARPRPAASARCGRASARARSRSSARRRRGRRAGRPT